MPWQATWACGVRLQDSRGSTQLPPQLIWLVGHEIWQAVVFQKKQEVQEALPRDGRMRKMRVVGKRKEGTGDRAGLDALVLKFGGGAPKGVFRYRTQEEANRDWDQWLSERVQRRMTMSAE